VTRLKRYFGQLVLIFVALAVAVAACSPTQSGGRGAVSPPSSGPAVVPAPTVLIRIKPVPTETPAPTTGPMDWQAQLLTRCWVAFSPTGQNPEKGLRPDDLSLVEDLQTLHAAGFDGLVTYAADARTHRLARQAGFKAMIVGVWDPADPAELALAESAGTDPLVLGYVVGNEGRGKRYDNRVLEYAVNRLRQATGKPVTTTEEAGDYDDPSLAKMGDWMFPNVHPYFAGHTDPVSGAAWTAAMYEELKPIAAGRPLLFKEVGLPTAGALEISEEGQAEYYRLLQDTPVRFVYFEAFDQPSKNSLPIEPYWGLFRNDRSPKPVVAHVCGR